MKNISEYRDNDLSYKERIFYKFTNKFNVSLIKIRSSSNEDVWFGRFNFHNMNGLSTFTIAHKSDETLDDFYQKLDNLIIVKIKQNELLVSALSDIVTELAFIDVLD